MVKSFFRKIVSLKREFKVYKYDGLILGMLLFIIVCSFVFSVHNNVSYIPVGGGKAIPGSCFFKYVTGHNCPTCGMTRSFISIGHGRFYDAMKFNIGGILAYVVCISFIVFYAIKLISRGTSKSLTYIWLWIKALCTVTCGAVLIGWIYFW